MSEPFDNVKGGDLRQTERDFETSEHTRDIRAKRTQRLRRHLTVDTDDSTAVLHPCGCVAGVWRSEVDAKEWAGREQGWDFRLVAAYTAWEHHHLRTYRRDDDSLIPDPRHDTSRHCDVHGWSEKRWAAWRQTRRDLGLEVEA